MYEAWYCVSICYCYTCVSFRYFIPGTLLSWYPRFPCIVVEALLLAVFLLEEEYLPTRSEAPGEAKKSHNLIPTRVSDPEEPETQHRIRTRPILPHHLLASLNLRYFNTGVVGRTCYLA